MRERADFLIFSRIDIDRTGNEWEQLWVRRTGEQAFEVCCIPFFVYDVSLGDIVVTAPRDGRDFVVDRVIKPSGHYTFRVWYTDDVPDRHEPPGLSSLARYGGLVEWHSRKLVAIDVASIESGARCGGGVAAR